MQPGSIVDGKYEVMRLLGKGGMGAISIDSGPTISVLQIADGGAGGTHEIFADAGLTRAKGFAYDPTNKRMFISDSNGTTVRSIRIIPFQ